MKKKMNYKKTVGIMFIGMIALMTSCVQGDLYELYEDDNLEQSAIITRNKVTKDGMNYMNQLGSNYPYHVLSTFIPDGCLQRALNDALGSSWVDCAAQAIASAYSYCYSQSGQNYQNKATYLQNTYYSRGEINLGNIEAFFDDEYVFTYYTAYFGLSCLSPCTPQSGDIVLTKRFSTWGGPDYCHCSCIASVGNGYYYDTDGNIWSNEFIDFIYR